MDVGMTPSQATPWEAQTFLDHCFLHKAKHWITLYLTVPDVYTLEQFWKSYCDAQKELQTLGPAFSPGHGSQAAALCCTTHAGRRCLTSFTCVAVSPAFCCTVNISTESTLWLAFGGPVAPSAAPQAPVEPRQSFLLWPYEDPPQQQVSQTWRQPVPTWNVTDTGEDERL